MKKLVYLLVLSLCVNTLAGGALAWLPSASAASKTEDKADKQSSKNSKKGKSSKEKKDADKKEKETKVEKEKEYKLDLAQNGTVSLSDILKYAKLDLKLKSVKKIELDDKEDKKYISWKADEAHEGDYIFTVLKSFKKLRLRISTKKESRLVVLLNGEKAPKEEPEKKAVEEKPAESKKEPAQEKEKAADEAKPEEPAEEKKEEPKEDRQEAPVEEIKEEPKEEKQEEPAEKSKEEPREEKQEAPAEDKIEEPREEKQEEPAEEKKEEPQAEQSEEPAKEAEASEVGIDEKQTEVEKTEPDDAAKAPETVEQPQSVSGDVAEVTEDAKAADAPQEATETVAEVTESQSAAAEAEGGNTDGQGDSAVDQGQTAGEQAQSAEEQSQSTEGQGQSSEEQSQATGEQSQSTEEQSQATGEQGQSTEEQSQSTGEQGQQTEQQGQQTEEQGQSTESQGEPAAEGGDAGAGDGTAQPEKGATIPADAEAWFKRGTELLWGTLEDVVAQLTGGETVYIQSGSLLVIKDAPLQLLSTVTMVPDGDVYGEGYVVRMSAENPAVVAEPTLLQPVQLPSLGKKTTLYVWVAASQPSEEEQGGEGDKPTLGVRVTGLEDTGWSRTAPRFVLSGIPEGKSWSYAAIIYDSRIVPIAGSTYEPDQEGIYTLRFAMLDELGDIMAASNQYTLQLDWTAPEVSIEVDEETSYTLNITASDSASGLDAVSVDAGKTWRAMDGEYTVTREEETTFKAGAIRVRDVAGNVYKSQEAYTVKKVDDEDSDGEDGEGDGEGDDGGSDGDGGGGSGDGSGTPALPHSSGNGEQGSDYNALPLNLPDEPMEQLTVGGVQMPLTLMLTSAQEADAPVGVNQPFTAKLRHWKDASDSEAPNTLLLDAEIGDNLGDVFTYEWRFNGEVYRTLANSGIKYVALKVYDSITAFPTEGFTGGTRYTELKMRGVSTRKFDYTVSMRLNLDPSHVSAMSESDFSQDCDLSIHTEVEEKNYELSNSPQSMMYFYNVFVGPEDMLDQPFGEYDANA